MRNIIKHINFLIPVLLSCLVISCSNDDRITFESVLENGQTNYESGSYDEAIKIWEKALELSPADPDLQFRLAKAHQHLAQFNISTQYLQQVIGNSDKTIDAYFMIIQNEIFVGNFEAAKKISNKLDTMLPKQCRVIALRGDVATFMGQLEEGEAYYRSAIELDSHCSEAHFKMAANLLVQGKETLADNHFRMAVDTENRPSVQYWLHIAEYHALRGDIKSAEAALNAALEIQPNSFFIKQKIAQLLLTHKRYDAIIVIFGNINSISSESTTIQKALVEALLNTNRLEKAQTVIQNLSVFNDPEWLLLAGKLSLLRGSYAHAISCFEQVLAKRINDPIAYYMLALSYLSADKENLATQTLIRLLSIVPEMIEAELAIASIYYKKAQYDFSIDYLQRVIKKVPDNPRLYIMIGNCKLFLEQNKEAETYFKKALSLDPQSITAQYYLALVKEKNGSPNEAIQLYKAILSKAPHMADVGLRLADLLILEKRTKEAIDTFSKLVERYSENGYLKFILGHVCHELRQLEKASHYYRLAIEDNPELVEAYKKLAELQTRNTQKIDIIKEAIKKSPNSEQLQLILSNYYFNEGKLDLALDLIKNINQVDPYNTTVANNLSWLYLEKDINLNDAYELASTAYEKDPKNPYYAHTLGVALYKKGIFQQSEWHLKEAIRLIEKDLEKRPWLVRDKSIFYYHLALTYMKNKKNDKARKELRYAVNLGLPKKYQTHALEILRE